MAFLFQDIQHTNFTNFITDVYQALIMVLNKSVSLWGYTFTWYDLLRFTLLTFLLGCCIKLILGGFSLNEE